jgi:hypothetical protein
MDLVVVVILVIVLLVLLVIFAAVIRTVCNKKALAFSLLAIQHILPSLPCNFRDLQFSLHGEVEPGRSSTDVGEAGL